MSSILSTQKRHTFLRRKYCFFAAIALSPPVGRWDAATGLPPLCSAMFILLVAPLLCALQPLPALPALVRPAPKLVQPERLAWPERRAALQRPAASVRRACRA